MQVFLRHKAKKYFDRLNQNDREQIKEALRDLEKEPPEGDIRPYEGNPGSLPALKPLSLLVEPPYTIEPASPQECAKVERRVREYHKNPQSFVPLNSIR